MSAIRKSGMGLQSLARTLVRVLSKLDGNGSPGRDSNSTFDLARVDERIAEMKAHASRDLPTPAPAPGQSFGKRRTCDAPHST
jgi:hypothetical protein